MQRKAAVPVEKSEIKKIQDLSVQRKDESTLRDGEDLFRNGSSTRKTLDI